MKEIGKEKFGLLYDKLYEHLIKNNGMIETVGIERGSTANEVLSELWKEGKTWETITLIIAYHYSRTDSIVIRYSTLSHIINHGISLKEIQRILGINIKKHNNTGCLIGRDEFDEEFERIWGILREKRKIISILSTLGISKDKSLLSNYWKQGKKWETVAAIIILLRLKLFGNVIVETEYGKFEFKKEIDTFGILEILQSKC